MAVKFFGQFLMEKGAITRENLLQAIELQEATNLKFGEIAMIMGFLTETQVEKIHDAQRAEDLRFGDMALKLGLISPEQMQQILTRQKNGHLYLGEALVRVGGLKEADLERYLEEFQADQAPYAAGAVAIPAALPHRPLLEIMADLSFKMLSRIGNIPLRPDACLESTEMPQADVVAAMAFSGAASGRYVLAVTAEVQKILARAILKEEEVDNEPEEVLLDAVMEFINIVCGNIAAKAAQMGKSLDIHPPEILAGSQLQTPPAEPHGLRFPMALPSGDTVVLQVLIAN
ncbi:MAG: chemotaxis protein CheX [Desulfuromonadales bacterium]|nr:chemotaxis protein CheX [Desulfuromonadales bacterium]